MSAGAVVVDPEAVLVRDPGLIVEPRFLAALRDELTAELGADGARTALLQIGCMHGLRDAEAVAAETFHAASASACRPATPALPLRVLHREPQRGEPGPILIGTWPEASEAQAWLADHPAGSTPVCAVSAGYTSGWLSGLFETDMVALETACVAGGATQCRFEARERLAWLIDGVPAHALHAERVPVHALREALSVPAPDAQPPDVAALQADEAVIHIWGPVMVIPFGGLDEAMQAVDLLRCDPAAARVTVIVMDLTGAIVDEAFGAATLEQIIDSAAVCGAETVLAGVSLLSEPAVAGLAHPPILVCKDLDAGIAAGFQVANSQRRIL